MKWTWVLGMGCGMAVVVATASAQTPSGYGERKRLEEVTVTAKREAARPFLPDVAGTEIYAGKKTSVIDLEQRPTIINNNYRQALAKTPGLIVSEETTPLVSIGYRGLAPDRAQFTNVLKDGVPITADPFGYPEAYYTPALESVERIEFLRGGASLMYGPQPGGALNYITTPPPSDTPAAAYSQHSFGTDQLYTQYTSVGGTVAPLGYYGYLQRRQGDGFRQANSAFGVLSGGLKAVLGADSVSRWMLAYDEYHEEHGEPGGLTRADADQNRDRVTRFNDRFALQRYAMQLGLEQDLGEASQLDVMLFGGYYQRWSKRQRGGGFGTLPSGSSASTNDIQQQEFYTLGLEPRFRHTYSALGQEGHTVTAGLMTYFSDSPREDWRGATPDADKGQLRNSTNRSVQYLSLFAEHLFRFGKLRITPGARLEHIWQHVSEETNLEKLAANRPLGDDDEFDFVPLFGLGSVYEAMEGLELYGNVSQAYRPKLFTQSVPTGALDVINNDLEAGFSWLYEAGLRQRQPDALWHWDVSYFLMDFDNQIGASGNTVENVGRALYQGLDLLVDVDAMGLVEQAGHDGLRERIGSLRPFMALTVLDAEFVSGTNKGRQPQYAPQSTLRLGADYAFRDRVKLSLTGLFVDEHFADDASTASRFLPSYKVWDLAGEINIWNEYVTLFGGINNLFDEHYWARVTSGGIDPAYERNVYGGIKVGYQF